MQKKDPGRIRWIDFARLLSMFFVVWLHTGAPSLIDITVHSFHMPVFYFLSGYCFEMKRHNEFKLFVFSRINGLMVPYIAFGVVYFIFWNLMYSISGQDLLPVLPYLKSLLWTCTSPLARAWGGYNGFYHLCFSQKYSFGFVNEIKSHGLLTYQFCL